MSEESGVYTFGKKVGALLSTAYEAWSDDEHIGLMEAGSVVLSGGKLFLNVFSNFDELKEVFSDGISTDELADLKAGLLEGYDLSDDTTEAAQEYIVEKASVLIAAVVAFFDSEDTAEETEEA